MSNHQRLCEELVWDHLSLSEQKSMCDICDDRMDCLDTPLEVRAGLEPIKRNDPRIKYMCKWRHIRTKYNQEKKVSPTGAVYYLCIDCRREAQARYYRKKQLRKDDL